jgi:hypothetical protein
MRLGVRIVLCKPARTISGLLCVIVHFALIRQPDRRFRRNGNRSIPLVESCLDRHHLDDMAKSDKSDIELIRTWTLSPAMTLGSSVRAKGLLQEIQARLPAVSKKSIILEGNEVILAMPATEKSAFNTTAGIVSAVMAEAETLPVIPREIQDILVIKTSERHRWLADGRLPSAGTRTVRLNGRARQITFHVFDPKVVEDLLDRGTVDEWRVEDAEAKAEKRQKAAYQRKLARSLKKVPKSGVASNHELEEGAGELRGWKEFDRDGFLR